MSEGDSSRHPNVPAFQLATQEQLGLRYLLRLLQPVFLPFLAMCIHFFLALALLGLLFLWRVSSEVEQEMAWDAADEVAHQLPALSALKESASVPKIFQELSTTNPELEPYVLDAQGTVVFPRQGLALTRVSLAPVLRVIGEEIPTPPVYGEDPRAPGRQALFVAAPLVHTADGNSGYVYLLVRSRTLAALGTLHGSATLFQQLFVRSLPFLIASIALGLGFAFYITQSFRRVLSLIRAYSQGDLTARWQSRTNDDIDELGMSIESVAREVLSQEQVAKNREHLRRGLLLEVVHDVRSPLMGIRAAIELMIREVLVLGRSVSPELLAALDAGITSIRNRSNALKAAAGLDLSPEPTHSSFVDPVHAAENAVAQVQSRFAARGLDIRVEHTQPIPAIATDPADFERILLNLIDNAERHTLSGGNVVISLSGDTTAVEISVRDSGVGIPPDEVPFVFERFFRGSAQNLPQGAGVGLTIVKRLVTLNGGTITVTSQLKVGSTFLIRLPRRDAASPQIEIQEPLAREKPSVFASEQKPGFAFFLFNGIYALVVLFLMPQRVTILGVIFYTLFSTWIGYCWISLGSSRNRILAVLPVVFAYAWWWHTTDRPYLSLTAIILGLLLGTGFANLVRSSDGKRSFLRLFALSSMLNAAAIAWATLMFHTTAEEELSRFTKGAEWEYAQGIAQKVSSFWCAKEDGQQSQEERKKEDFYRLQALNRKQYLALSGLNDVASADVLPQSLDYISPGMRPVIDSLYHSLSRVLSRPRRRLAVQSDLAGCASPVTLTVVFYNSLFNIAFKQSAHRSDIAFAGSAGILAFLFLFLVRRGTSWPHDKLIREIQQVVGAYLRDRNIQENSAKGNALSRPIVGAVSRLIKQCEVSRMKAETSDRDIRSLAMLAASEYGEFAQMLRSLVANLRRHLSASESTNDAGQAQDSREIIIRRMENIVEPEINLTGALFELTRLTDEILSVEVTTVYLAEMIESVVLDQLGILDAHSLIIHSTIPDEFQVSTDPRMLRFLFSSLLHGLARTVPPGTELTFTAAVADGKTLVYLRPFPERKDTLHSLGLLVAFELCRRVKIAPSFERDAGGEYCTGISLLVSEC